MLSQRHASTLPLLRIEFVHYVCVYNMYLFICSNFLTIHFCFLFSSRKAVETVLNKEHHIGGALLKIDRCPEEKNTDEVWYYDELFYVIVISGHATLLFRALRDYQLF